MAVDFVGPIIGVAGGALLTLAAGGFRAWYNQGRHETHSEDFERIIEERLKSFEKLIEDRLITIETRSQESVAGLQRFVEQRFTDIERSRSELSLEVRAATTEMRQAAIQIARLSESQSLVNRFTADNLQNLTNKTERQQFEIAELKRGLSVLKASGTCPANNPIED